MATDFTFDKENTFKKPGDIKLSLLSIHKKEGDFGLNLIPFMYELDLYEDLFSPAMTGTLLITDSIGMSSVLPIIGGEVIQIAYNTPSIGDYGFIRKKFRVYKLDSKIVVDSKSVYVLHLISDFAYKDNMVRISKKVSGNAITIIKDILQKDLKVNFEQLPIYYPETEPARNSLSFIAPNWSPITVINRIASLCTDPDTYVTDGELAGYLFFESTMGLNFYSLSDLTAISETDAKIAAENLYFYDRNPNRTKGMRDYKLEMQQILDLRVDAQFDMITRMVTGLYKNQVIEFDIIKKTANLLSPFDYMLSLPQKMYKLNEFPISPTGSDFGDGKLTPHVTYNKAISEIDVSINPVKNRIALSLLNSVNIEVTVWGRTDLSAGDQITLSMPSSSSPDKDNPDKPVDKLISGNYVITAIQHRINSGEHKMIMRISTDSYGMDASK